MLKLLQKKYKKPNRIVVLGSRGFVGSSIVQALKTRAISNLPISRKEINLLSNLQSTKLKKI